MLTSQLKAGAGLSVHAAAHGGPIVNNSNELYNMGMPKQLAQTEAESLSEPLRDNTVLALHHLRRVLMLKPKKTDRDFAKIISVQTTAALGILAVRARIDIEGLRSAQNNDVLQAILDRIRQREAESGSPNAAGQLLDAVPGGGAAP